MKNYFLELFEYHDQVNKKIMSVLYPKNDTIPEFAYDMLQHIIMAEHVWWHRVLKLPFDYDFKASLNEEQITLLMANNKTELKNILAQYDLETMFDYSNIKGEAFTSKLIDIVSHVSNHHTHHRGQIVRKIRESGLEPPQTDLILFRR